MSRIYLIVYYYLCFLECKRFNNLSTSAPGSRKTNLVIYGGSFSGQETSLVTIFDGCSMLEKKINLYSISDLDHGLQNKSKFRAISE